MTKTQETLRNYHKPIRERLSKGELIELDQELNSYREKKTIKLRGTKMEINPINMDKWLMDRGAINGQGAVIVNGYERKTEDGKDCEPILYEQLQEDIEQWKRWKGRQEFYQRKQAKPAKIDE